MSTHTVQHAPTREKREPRHPIHSIASASATEEASLLFYYIGVETTADAHTLWLDHTPKEGREVWGDRTTGRRWSGHRGLRRRTGR